MDNVQQLIEKLEALVKARAEVKTESREPPVDPQEEIKDPPSDKRPASLEGWHWRTIQYAHQRGDFDDDKEVLLWLSRRSFPAEVPHAFSWMN